MPGALAGGLYCIYLAQPDLPMSYTERLDLRRLSGQVEPRCAGSDEVVTWLESPRKRTVTPEAVPNRALLGGVCDGVILHDLEGRILNDQ